ncbi:MAG: ubiquinone/menaquinone biosynthesis methyltransferase [Planctomycetales bacterium]
MTTPIDGSQLTGSQREKYVTQLFNDVAGPYDKLNRIISLGRDPIWRRKALRFAGVQPGMNAADLGTGTGDFYLLLKHCVGPTGTVAGVDIADNMLAVARQKAEAAFPDDEHDLRIGSAAESGLPDESMDLVTMGWVLRNVGDRAAVYREVQRILKPSGKFLCVDMSHPDFPPLRWGAACYMRFAMPLMVRLCGGDMDAYRYLAKSTARFPGKSQLAEEFREAVFADAKVQSFMLGQIAAHLAEK